MKHIVLGADCAGVQLKNTLRDFLISKGYEVEDCGCMDASDKSLYPHIAERVCNSIIESGYEKFGLLVCGTGLGMAISANKQKGIRAGVCHDSFSGERFALSNNGNVICFGQRIIGSELAKKILLEWLSLDFVASHSSVNLDAVDMVERKNMK